MKRRFVQINEELVEVPLDWVPDPKADYHVMPDIKGHLSMASGKWIGSRSTHREDLKSTNCIEVGNEMSYMMKKVKPMESPPGLKEAYIRAVHKLRRH